MLKLARQIHRKNQQVRFENFVFSTIETDKKHIKKLMLNDFKLKLIPYFAIALLSILSFSCKKDSYFPKPRGYYQFDFPKKNKDITLQMDACAFTFQYPDYVSIEQDTTYFDTKPDHPCWLNLKYPTLNGTIHMSYKSLSGQKSLIDLTEDYHKMTNKHVIKAEFIDDAVLKNDKKKIYGLLNNVGGNVASTYQFYLTDSSNHFIRGSLYFKTKPNVDSLKPALDFVYQDLTKILDSWAWKD